MELALGFLLRHWVCLLDRTIERRMRPVTARDSDVGGSSLEHFAPYGLLWRVPRPIPCGDLFGDLGDQGSPVGMNAPDAAAVLPLGLSPGEVIGLLGGGCVVADELLVA